MLYLPNVFRSAIGFILLLSLQGGGKLLAQEPASVIALGEMREGVFEDSKVFPGTTRKYSVYVPNAYEASRPAKLMVFMDGRGYANSKGAFKAPAVIEKLIAEGKLPMMIAVFVNPGTVEATMEGGANRSNRSFEYDSLGDRYSRFLIDEFLPVAFGWLERFARSKRSRRMRHLFKRDLRVHGRLGTSRSVRESHESYR